MIESRYSSPHSDTKKQQVADYVQSKEISKHINNHFNDHVISFKSKCDNSRTRPY